MGHCHCHCHCNCWMPVLQEVYCHLHHPRRNHSQIPAQHSPHYSLHLLLSCCLLQSHLHQVYDQRKPQNKQQAGKRRKNKGKDEENEKNVS